MKRIKTMMNKHEFTFTGEANHLPSKTVPDQSLSPKQLLERFSRGLPLTGAYEPVYNGDVELPDFNRMDISEIAQLKDNVAKDIAEKQAILAETNRQARIKEDETRRKKIIEDYKKQQAEQTAADGK